jgi:hypothetical protein
VPERSSLGIRGIENKALEDKINVNDHSKNFLKKYKKCNAINTFCLKQDMKYNDEERKDFSGKLG